MRHKLLAFLIAILPVAYIYAFPILINNLGHAILLFLIFPILILDYRNSQNDNGRKKINTYYKLFCVYLILISIAAPVIDGFEGNFKEMLSAIEFSVIVFFLINDKKIGYSFINIYTKASIFFALFLIIQYVGFIFFKTTISGVIPFLEEYNREVESIYEGRILRISSVFAESSHFAVYEIPALVMLLFGKVRIFKPTIWIIVITIAILLSTSSNGILMMGIVYLLYVIYRFFRKINIVYIFIGGCIIISACYFVSRSEFIEDVTYGLFVQEADMTTSKAEMRIYRGFNMFVDMTFDKQLFGIGWRNAYGYCSDCNAMLYTKYQADIFDYFNSIAGTLIYAGFIGLFFLIGFFWYLFIRTHSYSTKTLILCIFILMGTSSILMSDQWILFLTTIIAMVNISNNEKNSNYSIAKCDGNC